MPDRVVVIQLPDGVSFDEVRDLIRGALGDRWPGLLIQGAASVADVGLVEVYRAPT